MTARGWDDVRFRVADVEREFASWYCRSLRIQSVTK